MARDVQPVHRGELRERIASASRMERRGASRSIDARDDDIGSLDLGDEGERALRIEMREPILDCALRDSDRGRAQYERGHDRDRHSRHERRRPRIARPTYANSATQRLLVGSIGHAGCYARRVARLPGHQARTPP